MKYVALILHGSLQSWGAPSLVNPNSGSPRNTSSVPTVGGINGLINSALGISRGENYFVDPAQLRIVTRVDRAGTIARDYQIAQRTHHGFAVKNFPGTKEIPKMYIQDATFVVFIGHEDDSIVEAIHAGFESPQFAPFLGRRAHVPSLPLSLGIVESSDILVTVRSVPLFWGNSFETTRTVTVMDTLVSSGSDSVVETNGFPLSTDVRDRLYSTVPQSVYSFEYSREARVDTLDQWLAIRNAITPVDMKEGENVSH